MTAYPYTESTQGVANTGAVSASFWNGAIAIPFRDIGSNSIISGTVAVISSDPADDLTLPFFVCIGGFVRKIPYNSVAFAGQIFADTFVGADIRGTFMGLNNPFGPIQISGTERLTICHFAHPADSLSVTPIPYVAQLIGQHEMGYAQPQYPIPGSG